MTDISPNAPQAVPILIEGTADPNAAQDVDALVVRVSPPAPPLPSPLADPPLVTDEQVSLTLAAMETAMRQLPLDDDLYIPREVEANIVRRSLLNEYISRLRVEHDSFRELEPKRVFYRDWITTLESCVEDLGAQLATAVSAAANKAPRAAQIASNLKYAIHDVHHGPDVTPSGEVLFDVLAKWFTDHHVAPLPGQSGFFAGRGGLHSAKARLKDTTRAIAIARAELENTLAAAQALITPEAGRGNHPFPLDLQDDPDGERSEVDSNHSASQSSTGSRSESV